MKKSKRIPRSSGLRSLIAGLAALAASSTSAETIRIPSDFATIQAGIDASANGDTVLVAPGTYSDCVHPSFDGTLACVLLNKGIVLRSELGADFTTLDAAGAGRVIFRRYSAHAAVVDGFTITGGSAGYGAGIRVDFRETYIRNCVVRGNEAQVIGGGLLDDGSFGLFVEACEFRENSAPYGSAMTFNVTAGIVSHCIIAENVATDPNGSAVSAYLFSPRFEDCAIVSNVGSALRQSPGYPGELILLDRCTIARNTNPQLTFGQGSLLVRCLVVGNLVCGFGDGKYDPYLRLDRCNVFDGTAHCYEVSWTTPNLGADPLFCAPGSGDFTLSVESPCLPANNPWGVLIGAFGEGCSTTPLDSESWGRIKGFYR